MTDPRRPVMKTVRTSENHPAKREQSPYRCGGHGRFMNDFHPLERAVSVSMTTTVLTGGMPRPVAIRLDDDDGFVAHF